MLSARARKIIQDFRIRKARTLLTALGLALGLWGLGTVLTAFAILSGDLDANYRNTDPPNFVMDTGAVTEQVKASIAKGPGVASVEERPIFSGRIKTSGERRLPIQISVIDDFEKQAIARVYSEGGAWPPPRGTMLIERDGRFFLRNKVGDSLDIRLSNGTSVKPVMSGLAFDPGVAPSRMELMLYGFVTRETWQDWDPETETSESRFLFTTLPLSETAKPGGHGSHGHGAAPTAEDVDWSVADHVKLIFEYYGVAVRDIRVLNARKHPHQFQLDAITILLGGLGIISLAMCIALVVNLIDAMLAGEIRAIGILKAIGATPGIIGRDYLLAMAALGLAPSLAAIPFAVKMGRGIALFIARFLNFEIITENPPIYLYFGLVLVGVGLPILAALPAVIKAIRVSVREALGYSGVSESQKEFVAISRWRLPLPLVARMALRNIFRKPRRLALTVLTLGFGLTFFLAAMNNRSTLLQTVVTVSETKTHDITVWMYEGYPRDRLDSWLKGYPEIKAVEYWNALRAKLSPLGNVHKQPTLVYAVPFEPNAIQPRLLAGRWLDPTQPEGVVVTQGYLARFPWMKVGSVFKLETEDGELVVALIGVVKEFGPGVVYIPEALAAELGVDSSRPNVALIALKASNPGAQRLVTTKLEKAIESDGWLVARMLPAQLLKLIVENHLDVIAQLLLIIAGLMLIVGVLGMASSISVNVVERFREIGVLKAIGGQSGTIRGLFVCEALFLSCLSWLAALLLAPWISRGIAKYFGELVLQYPLDYRAATWSGIAALGVALMSALIASAAPAQCAVRRTPRDALQYE